MNEENQQEIDVTYSSFRADYTGILDISPSERLKEWLFQYYARIHTDTKPQYVLSIICGVFICIQAISPAIMTQALIQQNSSVIAKTIHFLSVLWIGGGQLMNNGYEITSIIVSTIVLLILILITFRAFVFSKIKSMKNIEVSLIYGTSTFILPILMSFSANSIGISLNMIFRGNVDGLRIISLFTSLFACVFQCYFHYTFVTPRVMFIRDITLMWTPESAVLIPITTSVNAALYTASITNTGIPATVELIVMSIFSISVASYLFLDSMFINKTMGHMYSALLITNGTGTIINIVALYVKIEYTIIFFTIIIFIILSYLIFHYIWSRLSQISMITLDAASQDEFFYGRSDNLARDVRRSLDFCSPGIFMFSLYDEFLEDDLKNCPAMLYVYIRIISAFPSYKYKLEEVNKKLKDSNISCRRQMNFQINLLMCHRNTAATHDIIKIFDKINSQCTVISMNKRRFWEGILHSNTDTFWSNIDKLNQLIAELNKDLNQTVGDYENCPEVVSLCLKNHFSTTFNFTESRRLLRDLDLLERGIPAHKDKALINMITQFPKITNSISDLTREIDIVGNSLDHDFNTEDLSKQQIIYDLIKNAKVGKVGFKLAYFVIMAFLTIFGYIIFIYIYKMNFFDEVSDTYDFLYDFSTMMHCYSRYFFTKVLQFAIKQEDSPFQNDDAMMRTISPFWWDKGYVQRLDPSDQLIMNISNKIRANLENVMIAIGNLNQKRPSVAEFIDSFNNYKLPGFDQTFSDALTSTLMIENFDERFFNEINEVYQQARFLMTNIAEEISFEDAIEENLHYLSLTLFFTLFFYCSPMILTFFEFTIQMNEIATCYASLPTQEIRRILKSNEMKDEDANLALISSASVNNLKYPLLIGSLLCIAPPIILSYSFVFYARDLVLRADTDAKSAATMKTPMSDLRMSFIATILAFINAYPDSSYSENKEFVHKMIEYRDNLSALSEYDNSQQIVLNRFQLGAWIDIEDNYRNQWPPYEDSYDTIPTAIANWERLSSYKYMMMVDCFTYLAKLNLPNQTNSIPNVNSNAYFLWWVYDFVEKYYYSTLKTQTTKDIIDANRLIPLFVALDVITTIASLIFIIIQIVFYANHINIAMKMLQMVDLEVLMSDDQLFKLIQTGRSYAINKDSTFAYSEGSFLKNTETGIAIINPDYSITEYNKAFNKMLPDITDVKQFDNNELSMWLFNLYEKKADVSFSCDIHIKTSNDGDFNGFAECFALYDSRVLLPNEDVEITSVALVINDVSKFKTKENQIVAKHKFITQMLLSVIPNDILSNLQNGDDSISFTVHSITVGNINIVINEDIYAQTKFNIYSQIYKFFEETMHQYSNIIKLNAFGNCYLFATGIFMSINKPEKHAEDSVRFIMDIIKSLDQIHEKVKHDFSVRIGLHTGGPIIAGVISYEIPTLTIIGSVEKYSTTLMRCCDDNKIRISRSVYELIFSMGLKIAESEPLKIDTETVQSYTIDPK